VEMFVLNAEAIDGDRHHLPWDVLQDLYQELHDTASPSGWRGWKQESSTTKLHRAGIVELVGPPGCFRPCRRRGLSYLAAEVGLDPSMSDGIAHSLAPGGSVQTAGIQQKTTSPEETRRPCDRMVTRFPQARQQR